MDRATLFAHCAARVYEASSLGEAESAYYVYPYRSTLLGHVAKAKWEGFGMQLVSTVLGMCGLMDFPPERLMVSALATLLDMAEEGEEERKVFAKLLLALASDSSAEMSQEEMKIIATELSWRCPMGGETEAMLVRYFPEMISLPTVFSALMESRMIALKAEFDPYQVIRELSDQNAALRLRLGVHGE